MTALSASLPHDDLAEYLLSVLGKCTQAAFEKARQLVAAYHLTEAHVCDHPFFDSALVAHAVRENGGTVTLWPHSCNPAFPGLRRPGSVDAVHCVLASAARVWKAQLPDVALSVTSDLWLPRFSGVREVVIDEPLTVVLVANEMISGRVPVLDRGPLEETYRKLFRALSPLAPNVRYVCRPRSNANLQWLWELSGRATDFQYTGMAPSVIALPNMVFLFPGQAVERVVRRDRTRNSVSSGTRRRDGRGVCRGRSAPVSALWCRRFHHRRNHALPGWRLSSRLGPSASCLV